jgi:hypothetical protein
MFGVPTALAVCLGASVLASVLGTAQVLGWPLSKANLQSAIVNGILIGLPGFGVTALVTFSVRTAQAVWPLAIGIALTVIFSGVATFVVNANAAAC